MYELQSRVRYSELDADARLSIIGIMNYLQDCSTLQSEDCGVGLDWLENFGYNGSRICGTPLKGKENHPKC